MDYFATPERFKALLTQLASVGAEAEIMAAELDPETTEFHVLSDQIFDIIRQHTDALSMTEVAELAIAAEAAAMERIGQLVPEQESPELSA